MNPLPTIGKLWEYLARYEEKKKEETVEVQNTEDEPVEQ